MKLIHNNKEIEIRPYMKDILEHYLRSIDMQNMKEAANPTSQIDIETLYNMTNLLFDCIKLKKIEETYFLLGKMQGILDKQNKKELPSGRQDKKDAETDEEIAERRIISLEG